MARAFRSLRMVENEQFASIMELAAGEKINSSNVSRILQLTLLGPDVVEAILDERQRAEITLLGLIAALPI